MDINALTWIPRGNYDQCIDADSMQALISQAVQGTTVMEAYSCNVWVTETLEKEPKAMSVKDWVITQNKDPEIREIKYLINNKRLKGRKVCWQEAQITKQYFRQCGHLVLHAEVLYRWVAHQRRIQIHYNWWSLRIIKGKLCKDVMMTLDTWD